LRLRKICPKMQNMSFFTRRRRMAPRHPAGLDRRFPEPMPRMRWY
jgi:hypothetical protein